jgi:hypothetical protein
MRHTPAYLSDFIIGSLDLLLNFASRIFVNVHFCVHDLSCPFNSKLLIAKGLDNGMMFAL